MKHILSLDGGGIRGVFSLEILLRIETLLREHHKDPKLVLADHFDFMAGTSTGAIIATCLSWGMPVEGILGLYVQHATTMFQPMPWYRPLRRLLVSRYEAKPLSDLLRRTFSEDGKGEVPALLDTKRLKTLLLVVVRNHTTGSAWPITNNPAAKYNQLGLPDCNLKIPLWKVVRASTAAPVYFDPEEITLGDRRHVFVDGSITPYNNPALIAALTAILPCYRLEWETGLDKIRLISVGTVRFSLAAAGKNVRRMWVGYNAPRIPLALIQGIGLEQDYLCRCLGQCLHGEELDSEVGNLEGVALPGRNWFSYVRYNKSYLGQAAEKLLKEHPQLAKIDAVHAVPLLRELGRTYAQEHVRIEHLI
ncbi:MAG: patatin-like phospholipase family protein [Candidatus Acidiferrales bacterium]